MGTAETLPLDNTASVCSGHVHRGNSHSPGLLKSLFPNSISFSDFQKRQLNSEKPKIFECPNSPLSLILYNSVKKEGWKVNCNSYKCEYCGPRKANKLRVALSEYFKNWEWIRLFTFTLTSRSGCSPDKHYFMLCEAFRRFTTELRRRKMFSSAQKNFQYIRVMEPHKSGYFHLHCFFDTFFKVTAIYPIWNNICRDVLIAYDEYVEYIDNDVNNLLFAKSKVSNVFGWVDARGSKSNDKAAYYVTKYVLKSVMVLKGRKKKWTKSGKIKLFPDKIKNPDWVLVNVRNIINEYYHPGVLLNYFSRNAYCSTSQSDEVRREEFILRQINEFDFDCQLDEIVKFSSDLPESQFERELNDNLQEIYTYFERASFLDGVKHGQTYNKYLGVSNDYIDSEPF
jgi:hypothetical protein